MGPKEIPWVDEEKTGKKKLEKPPVFIDLTDLPTDLLERIQMAAAEAALEHHAPAGQRESAGKLYMTGSIKSFTIGGQELWIDDICPSTSQTKPLPNPPEKKEKNGPEIFLPIILILIGTIAAIGVIIKLARPKKT